MAAEDTSAAAPQSLTMYAASAALRCVLMGVKYSPALIAAQ